MADTKEDLKESLKNYELQLSQINDAISQNDSTSEELVSLRENIVELIHLTKDSIGQAESSDSIGNEVDTLHKKYEFYKAELDNGGENNIIEDDFEELIGSKCQAPFKEQWSSGSETFHNALITGFDWNDSVDIKVSVMFVNPMCREMVPCSYYLDGKCKFSEDKCHYSHGYIVPFADLREYVEPDFRLLQDNASVLAKDDDDLWKRAIITAVINEQHQCSIKFESGNRKESLIDFHNIFPLGNDAGDDLCVDDRNENETQDHQAVIIEESFLYESPCTKLGEWEKYTSGIGSKLMAKMGYVTGTGLGKNSEGRIEPVPAVALPPGKSLDHCMELREKSGGDPNLFRVDRLQKKLKFQKQNHKAASNIIHKKPKNVFAFINDALSGNNKHIPSTHSSQAEYSLKACSARSLNVQELKLTESIQKKQHELYVLRDTLTRHKNDTVGHKNVASKVRYIEGEIKKMQRDVKNIEGEKSCRRTMKELTRF